MKPPQDSGKQASVLIRNGDTNWAATEAALHVAGKLFGCWQLLNGPMTGFNAKLLYDR
ncbi:hypothetical protein MTX78_01000 [Hymenobacter tibetensis]|uniref:Uncharacterized protein n=1 Tax=Hymenobacter tibetensis TaxID=497967 RepID=A0ABY4D240_9BACT|nr:hypothetical protein [Hymenobacter tibetensis]UOG75191.1 hypothetical protein MTX78_01000 [Hymenobacter tibetensis]